MKTTDNLVAGLAALLVPFHRYAVDPDEGGGEALSPALTSLFGLVADDAAGVAGAGAGDAAPNDETIKPGLNLQQAIAEPSDEDKAEAKAAADKAAAEKAVADKAEADKKAADAAEAAKKVDDEEPIRATKKAPAKSQADLAAEAEAKKKETEAKSWEDSLLDEERDQLQLARYAEQKNPAKYKGLAAKTEKFLKDLAAKTDAADFDPDSEVYQDWLEKERPVLSNSEVRILERERGADTAREEATKQGREVLDKTYRMIETPNIKRDADAYFVQASNAVLPDEVAKVFKESPAKAKEEYPMEYEIVERVMSQHADDIEELFSLTRRNPDTGNTVKAFNAQDPRHNRVLNMVTTIESEFKKTGGAETVRDGRRFLTRGELSQVAPKDHGKYWTFSSKEIAERSTALAKAAVNKEITGELDRLKRLGFERKAKVVAAPAAPAAKSPPAARPSPMPAKNDGGSSGSATDNLLREMGMGT